MCLKQKLTELFWEKDDDVIWRNEYFKPSMPATAA